MKKLILFKFWLFLGIIFVGVAFFLFLTPVSVKTDIPYLDKLVHFTIYFLLAWWFVEIFSPSKKIPIFISFFAMGVIIEILQYFVPGRSFDLWDIAANTLGNMMAIVLLNFFYPLILFRIDQALGKLFITKKAI